jgi:Acyclic terpene utilisation family protein AtuA
MPSPRSRSERGTLAIGSGSAYANDRLAPAAAIADSGRVTYIGFDCLAERTMALAHVRRRRNPAAGQDERIRRLLPLLRGYLASGGGVVGNFGAANPDAAAGDFVEGLRDLGLPGVRLGVIRGDDVLDLVRTQDAELPELGTTVGALGDQIVSANAYIGAEPIVDCLREDAQIVLGGRLADPSLFVGPICHELGWSLDDWEAVGHATMVGHLLECGVHSTGGNFEDPPYRVVPDPHRLGFPLAEVSEDAAVITKLDGTGGAVDERTMKTQLYYEIHDPRTYLTPDVTADFSSVRVEDLGGDRVRLSGATGREWPATLKVLVGVDQGYRATGEISYGGPGCVARARRAEEILRAHLDDLLDDGDQVRVDLQGLNSLFGDDKEGDVDPREVRLRLAVRTGSEEVARDAAHEVELLYFGPAGGGGVVTSVVPALGVTPAYVPRELVTLETEVVTS